MRSLARVRGHARHSVAEEPALRTTTRQAEAALPGPGGDDGVTRRGGVYETKSVTQQREHSLELQVPRSSRRQQSRPFMPPRSNASSAAISSEDKRKGDRNIGSNT